MRRVLAFLAISSLAQTAVLRTGLLCEGGESAGQAMAAMPGMPVDRDAAPGRSEPPRHDRHHDGAHCPLMVSCAALAVKVAPIAVPAVTRAASAVPGSALATPPSEKLAPEPPPPKR
jgi:hypothetical protein